MKPEQAAPCRHAGAPPQNVIEKTVEVIQALAADAEFLNSRGLTKDEYSSALPAAIELIRGRAAASNSGRRRLVASIFSEMKARGLVTAVQLPIYGRDTVYRLGIGEGAEIAVIQKGCPDGAHSSVAWEKPEWASETYIWWVCSSTAMNPGEHVLKGVNRLRRRLFEESERESNGLDGVIFHSEMCGTSSRPCPKMERAIKIDGIVVPPPCLYLISQSAESPARSGSEAELKFPTALLSLFSIPPRSAKAFLGSIDFEKRGDATRTSVALSFGQGRSTNYRTTT